jgi:hypothetical protein
MASLQRGIQPGRSPSSLCRRRPDNTNLELTTTRPLKQAHKPLLGSIDIDAWHRVPMTADHNLMIWRLQSDVGRSGCSPAWPCARAGVPARRRSGNCLGASLSQPELAGLSDRPSGKAGMSAELIGCAPGQFSRWLTGNGNDRQLKGGRPSHQGAARRSGGHQPPRAERSVLTHRQQHSELLLCACVPQSLQQVAAPPRQAARRGCRPDGGRDGIVRLVPRR